MNVVRACFQAFQYRWNLSSVAVVEVMLRHRIVSVPEIDLALSSSLAAIV
jgi:hypothetical protein